MEGGGCRECGTEYNIHFRRHIVPLCVRKSDQHPEGTWIIVVLTLKVGVAEHLPFSSPVPHTLLAKLFNARGITESPSRERRKWLTRGLNMSGKCLSTIGSIQPGLYMFIG